MNLNDICKNVTSGGTPLRTMTKYWHKGNIPWLKTGEIKHEYITSTEEFITEEGLKNSSAKIIPKNSVLIAMYGDGDTAGNVAINKIELTTNQACCNLIIDNKKAYYRYVYFYLKANYTNLINLKLGGSQQNLNATTIKRIGFPSVSLEVQHKIAAILSAYDDLIENNNRRIAILERMGQELYREWFVRLRFPGHEKVKIHKGLPEGWAIYKLGDLIVFEKGKNPIKLSFDKIEGTEQYLNIESIEKKEYQYAPVERATFIQEDESLMLMDGARSSLVLHGYKGIVGSTFAVFRTQIEIRFIIHEYLKVNMQAIMSNNTGSAIPHANKKYIFRMQIILPKNNKILKKYNNIYGNIFREMQILKKKNNIMKLLKERCMCRLMSGKLDVSSLDIRFPASMIEEESA